ncbi:MAG TPA: POTRA domain-containing protein, partial [Vicinamibacterales bacterium]
MGRREPVGCQLRGVTWTTVCWALAAWLVVPTGASGQTSTIAEVRVEREGRPVADPALLALIETRIGEALSAREVRETIAHLNGLDAFEDVRVEQETLPSGGIRLRYVLVPAHPIDRIEFEGQLGDSERDLRRVVVDQFGVAPRATQAGNAQQALVRALRDRGYPQATVEPRIVETHDPDRATLTFTINAGARASIVDLRITLADDPPQPGGLLEQLDIRRGEAYDKAEVDRALDRWTGRMRARGHYEARASHGALFPPDGAVVSITLTQGPQIHVAFAGDPLDESDRNRLVPVQAEGSADEDLLEDSARAIEAFLRSEGHRDARADYDRVAGDAGVVITFTVDRGPRYVVGAVRIAGLSGMTPAEVRTGLRLSEGDSFSEEDLAAGVAAVRNTYRARGFARVQVHARQ